MKRIKIAEISKLFFFLFLLLPNLIMAKKYQIYNKKNKPYVADLEFESGKYGLYHSKSKVWYISPEFDSIAKGFNSHIGFKNGLMTLFGDLTQSGYEILAEDVSAFFKMTFGDGEHDVIVKNGKWIFLENQNAAFDSILQRELYYSPYNGATIIVVKDGSYALYETKTKKLVVLNDVISLEQIEPFNNFKYRKFYIAKTQNAKCGLVSIPEMIHSQFLYDTLFHYPSFSTFYACDLKSELCDKFMETDLEKTIGGEKGSSSGMYVNHSLSDVVESIKRNEEQKIVTLEEFQSYTFFNTSGSLGVKFGTEVGIIPVTSMLIVGLGEEDIVTIEPVGNDSLKVVSGSFNKTYFKKTILDKQIFDLVHRKGNIMSMTIAHKIITYVDDFDSYIDISNLYRSTSLKDTMKITVRDHYWECPLCHGYGIYKGNERVVTEEIEVERKVLVGQESTTSKGYFEHTSLLDGKTYYSYYTKVNNVYEYVKEKEIVQHTVSDYLVCPYIDSKQYERLKNDPLNNIKFDHILLLIWDDAMNRYVGHSFH